MNVGFDVSESEALSSLCFDFGETFGDDGFPSRVRLRSSSEEAFEESSFLCFGEGSFGSSFFSEYLMRDCVNSGYLSVFGDFDDDLNSKFIGFTMVNFMPSVFKPFFLRALMTNFLSLSLEEEDDDEEDERLDFFFKSSLRSLRVCLFFFRMIFSVARKIGLFDWSPSE